MSTSTAQGAAGTSLTFLETMTGSILGWTASVALWQDTQHGNYLVAPGMLATGSCIPSGDTVASVGRTPGVGGYGTVVLTTATSSACASGTAVTFTLSPTQLQALTVDWLGIQSAVAAAWGNSVGAGGNVYIPAGTYRLNHSVINPMTNTNYGPEQNTVSIAGAGIQQTSLQWPSDVGTDQCGISEAFRLGTVTEYVSGATYRDFFLEGPNGGTINGAASAGMDGLCFGKGAIVDKVQAQGFHAGFNGNADHWYVRDSVAAGNQYGVYFSPYTITMGNQYFANDSFDGNSLASFGVAATDQMDSVVMNNVSTGFSPYGFYLEAVPSTVTGVAGGFLTNTTLENVWGEALGNGWIYGTGQTGTVNGDTFIGAAVTSPGLNSSSYKITASPVVGLIYAGAFNTNVMLNTSWGSGYSYATTAALIDVGTGACDSNMVIGDTTFVTNSTSTVAPYYCTGQFGYNTFSIGQGSGIFKYMLYSSAIQGTVVLDYGASGGNGVVSYSDGYGFGGITAGAAASGATVAVFQTGTGIPTVRTNTTQTLTAGQPLYPSAGGVIGGLSIDGAIGIVSSTGSSSLVYSNIGGGLAEGSPAAYTALTAAGTTQGTAYNLTTAGYATSYEFTTVASGSGAILSEIPNGKAINICNDGANALLVYPQSGAKINALSTNAGYSLAVNTCAAFKALTTTFWHT
jgi:hypothetical protein